MSCCSFLLEKLTHFCKNELRSSSYTELVYAFPTRVIGMTVRRGKDKNNSPLSRDLRTENRIFHSAFSLREIHRNDCPKGNK